MTNETKRFVFLVVGLILAIINCLFLPPAFLKPHETQVKMLVGIGALDAFIIVGTIVVWLGYKFFPPSKD